MSEDAILGMRELLAALELAGVQVPFHRIEYLLRTKAISEPKRGRHNERLFSAVQVSEVLAIERKRRGEPDAGNGTP